MLDATVLAIALLVARILEKMNTAVQADEAYQGAAVMAGSLCALMLLVAILTKPDGRAERAREIFQRGLHANCQNRAEGIAISLVMIIALYGSYALVEGCKRWRMQHRLVAVDSHEVARVMAAISAAPMGLSWKWLLKNGRSEKSLRGPVAALLLNGWIKILDNGNTLVQQSPSMRALLHRHPLADVFQPGE
jgi:hypothetical protein